MSNVCLIILWGRGSQAFLSPDLEEKLDICPDLNWWEQQIYKLTMLCFALGLWIGYFHYFLDTLSNFLDVSFISI